MGLSKLSERCRACPFVDTCDHKRMEAYGYLDLEHPNIRQSVSFTAAVDSAKPMIMETKTIYEIEKELYKVLYSALCDLH